MNHLRKFFDNIEYQPGDHLTPEFKQREEEFRQHSQSQSKMVDEIRKKDARVKEIMDEMITAFEQGGAYQAKMVYDKYIDEIEGMKPYNSVFLQSSEMIKLLQSDPAAERTQIKDPKKILSDLLKEINKKASQQNEVPKRGFIQKFRDFIENPSDPTAKYRGGW